MMDVSIWILTYSFPLDWQELIVIAQIFFNPFFPNAPFLYPLEISENRNVFWCLQGAEKGCIGNEWVKF